MPGGEFGDFSNVKPGPKVARGVGRPETNSFNGGSESNMKKGPKTSYVDRVSKATVKRAS